MDKLISRLTLLAAGLVLALVMAPALAAPVAPTTDAKKTETPAEKIKKALDETTDLEISDQPLHLAMAQLREQTKVNFVVDRQVIAMMGLDPDSMPINVKLQKVKLRSGLRSMLSQYNLTFAIVGDACVITTEDMAMYRQLRQRVNIDFNRTQFTDAIKQLAKDTGTNLIIDPRMHKESQSPVTLQLEDVPLDTAVRLLSEMAGLKPVRMGNVLFVTSKASANELKQDQDFFPNPNNGGPEGMILPGGIGGIGGAFQKLFPPPAVPQLVPPAPNEKGDPVKPDGAPNPGTGTTPPKKEDR